jgi:TonB family protein
MKARLALLPLLVFSTSAEAADPVLSLKPSSKWVLDYGDRVCRLVRNFGEGDKMVALILDKVAPGELFSLVFRGKPMQAFRSEYDFRIQFGPEEPVQDVSYYASKSTGNDAAIFLRGRQRIAPIPEEFLAAARKGEYKVPPPISAEREHAVKYLQLIRRGAQDLRLETGSMKAAFGAMDKCLDSLVTSWGFDAAKIASAQRRAIPISDPRSWMTSKDYPQDALENRNRGLVTVRINVSADGKPDSCHIHKASMPDDFEEAVCKALLRKASFVPALDQSGAPMPSFYVTTVNFTIPAF